MCVSVRAIFETLTDALMDLSRGIKWIASVPVRIVQAKQRSACRGQQAPAIQRRQRVCGDKVTCRRACPVAMEAQNKVLALLE